MLVLQVFISIAVVVSGASVLALEILGTRLIGPYYGVSLYLWSALIGVTLAALSTGYAVGGRLVDSGRGSGVFSLIIGLAGLWIVTIPWLRLPVLNLMEPAGLRAAVLVTSLVLFFPPLALLGMVSPFAVRMKTKHIDHVGRTAGNLAALSTIASVAAALLTGFVLVPNMGVTRLTVLIGMLLIVTAVIGVAVTSRRRSTAMAAILATAAAWGAVRSVPAAGSNLPAGVISVEYSAYGEIRVAEKNGLRFLIIDGGVHTIAEPGTWVSGLPYVDVLEIAKTFHEEPGSLLLVGLGGGSVVKNFARDGWKIDAVEIDPSVTRAARNHFGLLESEAVVHHADGRRFLVDNPKTYDLVILDAFGSSSVPFHMTSVEAFELVRSRLAPGGVLAMNMEAVGWRDIIVRSLAATLHTQFGHVVVLPTAEPPSQLGNVILLASDRPLEPIEEPAGVTDRYSGNYNLVHAWDNRFDPERGDAPILTDDLNPVGLWAERINLAARNHLHEYFGHSGVDR